MLGGKNMSDIHCPYKVERKTDSNSVFINCRGCEQGSSTLFDDACRANLFSILQKEYGIDRIVLNHTYVKVFTGNELLVLKKLAEFGESIQSYKHVHLTGKDFQECKKCLEKRKKNLSDIIEEASSKPGEAFLQLKKMAEIKGELGPKCFACNERLKNIIFEMLGKGNLIQFFPDNVLDTKELYTSYLRPYVRPGFIDSYIQLDPPADATFLESYEVEREGGYPMKVSIYSLSTRPEKLYFVVPSEFDLPRGEVEILEKLRDKLSHHRPKDATFMDAQTAEEYFRSFGKKVIAEYVNDNQIDVSMNRIGYLADIFARYSAGFGILGDILSDNRIQDVYVNAPVSNNPLHIVYNGEECTSNVYLSNKDIEAISSRFRTLSGRAFSEAAPVLDMDLDRFSTRVAAISNPLTPRGVAFALRRHRQKPWTLAHFVANNMISSTAAGFLSFLIDGQASLLIAGSRGAGKTSLLGALMLEIPQRYRILTIEDTSEIPVDILQTYGYKIQSLLTKSIASGSASTEVSPQDALRTALRLGESVLILGEVRGVEAKVLFEAMRVGAAGNLIMGTIHGATTRDVYERVVYDIGVPSTSFKAVDAVVIAAPIRVEGGMDRKRRVVQISEITKTGWGVNPNPEEVFEDVMLFDASKDLLEATDILDMGQSQVLGSIAKKWGISVEKALDNIRLRTQIKETIVDYSQENIELLEAKTTRDANNAFWMLLEQSKEQHGSVDYEDVGSQWHEWFKQYVRRMQ
jgi:type IV secretory pathway ATPase VirB11/archaellum biosynthesis ATPase